MAVLIGIEAFEQKLKALELSVQRKLLTKTAKAAAELIRAEAQRRAPVDSGALERNQVKVTSGAESNAFDVTIRIGTSREAFWGYFQEFGTAHQSAQPFLGPAFEAKKAEALQMCSAAFKQAVENISV